MLLAKNINENSQKKSPRTLVYKSPKGFRKQELTKEMDSEKTLLKFSKSPHGSSTSELPPLK